MGVPFCPGALGVSVFFLESLLTFFSSWGHNCVLAGIVCLAGSSPFHLGVDLLGKKPRALGSVVTPTLLFVLRIARVRALFSADHAD